MRFEHRTVAWPALGAPPMDVQPGPEGWLALAADGALWAVGSDGEGRVLARVDLGPIDPAAAAMLRVSRDARFAAVANRHGRYGRVFDLERGLVTLEMDRGDYFFDVSTFSMAFFELEGRTRLVHATNWNRLDVSDPATGELLTPRGPTAYSDREERPEHYLDYFHAGLSVSPDGRWVVDDGWHWHPLGTVRAWSLADWLGGNVWESEDGPSVRELCARDSLWDCALCWLGDRTVAVWGFGDDEMEMEPGVRIFDVTSGEEIRRFPGPDVAPFRVWPPGSGTVGRLAFDRFLFAISPENGTGVWDVGTSERIHFEPGFAPLLRHPLDGSFLTPGEGAAVVSRLVD